jgi:phosphoglycolate phosphatase
MPARIICQERVFPEIEGIIFDKDGTLEDSGSYLRVLAQQRARTIDTRIPGVGASLVATFGIKDDKLDPAGLQAIGSRQENTIAAAAYIAATGIDWATAMEIATQSFNEADKLALANPTSLFPRVVDRLNAYAAADLKLGIVSAATTASVMKFATTNHLTTIFSTLLGSDGQFAKPDARLFLLACQQMGTNPHRTLMVGDGVWDMVMAKKAGAAGCIGINWQQPDATLAVADITIDRLDRLEVD